MGADDALLAARLGAGDDHALAEVFDQLAAAVYGGATRVLGDGIAAQDVVQDVFVQLWTHPDRYDPAAGSLRSYLIMLARHRAVDVLRSELRREVAQAAGIPEGTAKSRLRLALARLEALLDRELLESS